MRLIPFLRATTLILMAVSLLVLLVRPDLGGLLRRILYWVVPAWIVMLFFAQLLIVPGIDGVTPLEALGNRLRRRTWTCPRCGAESLAHVGICRQCGDVRPAKSGDVRPEESGDDPS